MTLEKSKGTVWDDIATDPDEAAQLKIKAALFDAIRAYIKKHKLTLEEAAERMGVLPSRIGDISRGKLDGFTIDYLDLMAERVGVNPLKITE